MQTRPGTVASFYDGWGLSNERLVETIRALSVEQLGLRAATGLWPI